MKRTISLVLALVLCFSLSAVAFADTITTSGGQGTVPVTITAEAATFSVTVPTSIPLAIGADGTVTAPSNLELTNESASGVKVTSVTASDSSWSIVDYNGGDRSDLAAEAVDSNKLGLQLTANSESLATTSSGTTMTPSNWTMEGYVSGSTTNNTLSLSCDAIATAVSSAITSATTAADVVFVLAWDI